MVNLKRMTLLAAAAVVAGLFLAQPARALTAIAQPYLISIDQGRGEAMQPIKHSRCHGYRDGGHGTYRHCGSRVNHKPKGNSGSYQPSRRSGYHKPWGGHEPCANCPAAK